MYIENSKDIYGASLSKTGSCLKCHIPWLEETVPGSKVMINLFKYQKKKKKICPTDPTLHRACDGKQIIFLALECCDLDEMVLCKIPNYLFIISKRA